MWQRFTERARKVVFFAQEEAQLVGAAEVSPEHLLLGVLREDCSGRRALDDQGDNSAQMAEAVRKSVPQEVSEPRRDMTLSQLGKQSIDFAYDEARNLGNNYIGTEHLLLALARQDRGVASGVLAAHGIRLEDLRKAVMRLQEDHDGKANPLINSSLSPEIVKVLNAARSLAIEMGDVHARSAHLLIALMAEPDGVVLKAMSRLGIDIEQLRRVALEVQKQQSGGQPNE